MSERKQKIIQFMRRIEPEVWGSYCRWPRATAVQIVLPVVRIERNPGGRPLHPKLGRQRRRTK